MIDQDPVLHTIFQTKIRALLPYRLLVMCFSISMPILITVSSDYMGSDARCICTHLQQTV